MPTRITIKKLAQGKYQVFKNGEKVVTATFTKKYYPMPNLPKGFEMSFRVKGKKALKVVSALASHRQQLFLSSVATLHLKVHWLKRVEMTSKFLLKKQMKVTQKPNLFLMLLKNWNKGV